MNLRSVDLNLLVALDALLRELHVTRAAERIGLSQPAMSNALSRLRHVFKDELLVRTAAGMQATPRAIELAAPTRQALRQIERVLESDSAFDPARSDRTFTLRLSDLLALLLLPDLAERLGREASGVDLDILHLPPVRTVEALEKDEIDVAVSMDLDHSTSIRSETLLADRMVCVMRKGHPLARKPLTIESFLAQRHLKVSMSPTDLRFVDNVLARIGTKRHVAANVPHWLLVPKVLSRTDLLSVMAAAIAAFSPVHASAAVQHLGYFVLGCIWACAVAVAYSVYILRHRAPSPLRPPSQADLNAALVDALLTGIFVGASLGLAAMLGLEKAYWVPVSCLAVMQGVTLRASWSRNVHRIVGTVIGMGLTWLLLPFLTDSWAIAIAVTVLTFLIETAVVRHYAFAAIFITPLTILLAETTSPGALSPAMLMQTRLMDTVVGALIGLLGAVCLHNHRVRRFAERGLAAIGTRK